MFILFIDFIEVILISGAILTFIVEKQIEVFNFNFSIEIVRLGILSAFIISHVIYLSFTLLMIKNLYGRKWDDDKIRQFWKSLLLGSLYKYRGTIVYYWNIKRNKQDFNMADKSKQIIYKILYNSTIITLFFGLIMLILHKNSGLILLSAFPLSAYSFYLLMLSHFSNISDLNAEQLDYYFAFLPSSNVLGCFAYYRKFVRKRKKEIN